jgi:phospholipid/cholesterol/gamma-HCH transport system substrate-binding protein
MSTPRSNEWVRRRNALLGLVALSLFAATIYATWVLLKGGFEGGVPVRAVFSAPGVGQQLPIGGDIKVRGVLVGRIHDITLEDGNAIVHLRLQEGVDIPASARAEIRSKTVFGQKWLELIPPEGTTATAMLGPGSVIPDTRTKEPLELERALQLGHDLLSKIPLGDLSAALHALSTGFGGQEKISRETLRTSLVALRAVNARAPELDLSLRQLRDFSQWLDENDTSLLSFMKSVDASNQALVGAAPEFKASLRSVPSFLNDFSDFQEATNDDLGRLIDHGATLAEFVAARSAQLTDIVVELRPFTTVWNSGLRQPCNSPFEFEMHCWQVYQMPGLESRGLYGPGEAPDADEPGDPLYQVAGEAPVPNTEVAALLKQLTGSEPPTDLVRLLTGPLEDLGRR